MSAPPNGLPNGRKPPPPGAPPLRRKKNTSDPLVSRKKPVPRPASKTNAHTGKSLASKDLTASKVKTQPHLIGIQAEKVDEKVLEGWKLRRRENMGWWNPPPPDATDLQEFPVYITKAALKDGLRAHLMRFGKTRTNGPVDITNQDAFARPVTLHRKDPAQIVAARAIQEASPTPATVDELEAERQAKLKLEKEAQRAVDQAQIAPVSKEAAAKRQTQKPEKSTTQTYYPKRTEAQKKQASIRYEESLPWVLEDADGKNSFVGTYVAELSETSAVLSFETGGVRLLPLEKYYRFTQQPNFRVNSSEEAEKLMSQKMVQGRWTKKDNEKSLAEEEMNATRKYLRGGSKVKLESSTFKAAARSEKQDHDDIDFSGDEFQDDDENPTFEQDNNDEEAKDTKERVRREQLGANLFGDADEKQVDKTQLEEMMEELARDRQGKGTRKALIKREKHMEYKSDPDSDDWGSSSSDDSSDDDKQDVKKEEDDKAKADQKPGNSSKGGNTPLGKQKAAENAKKGKNLKRPGSPNLSESSGNESSRKKHKKQATGSAQPSRSSTPVPGSQRASMGAGATSDGEATGGEMSDGGRSKKPKVKKVGTHSQGTPSGSRAGSPAPAPGQLSPGPASPSRLGPSTPRAASPGTPVDAAEIVAALAANPEGITVGKLLIKFQGRVGESPGLMSRRDWIKLVKEHSIWGADKLLRPKDS